MLNLELDLTHPTSARKAAIADPSIAPDSAPRLEALQNPAIYHWIEAQATQHPTRVALVHQGRSLTYHDLNHAANQLAHALRRRGVGAEVCVGLYLERSVDMVIGLLAILKAGGAYVPLDPAFPNERLIRILQDSQMQLVLTTCPLLERLLEAAPSALSIPALDSALCLDAEAAAIAQEPIHNPAVPTRPEHLAYVIYTSGSTGHPKGVMIEHRALVNYASNASVAYGLTAGDRVLQFCSISFDAAVEEIFCTLIQGATLVLRTDAMLSSISSFLRACTALEITTLSLPTAFWHHITVEMTRAHLPVPATLRLVIIGGERAIPERFREWHRHVGNAVQVFNTYGPTETTVIATLCNLTATACGLDGELPIGQALAGLQTHVLTPDLKPVLMGDVGELYIGGAGVARGYRNRPELTEQRFIQNPFSAEGGDRLYRTGDLVRQQPNGHLEFVGRVDHQVKIRGFRVELFEIEAVLEQHPIVQDAVVIAWRDRAQHQRLAAYVVLRPDIAPQFGASATLAEGTSSVFTDSVVPSLRHHLAATLPDYMVPTTWMQLDQLPLSPTGKVDRRQLPEPLPIYADAGVAPRTVMEQAIARLWCDVLGVESVSVHDSFFHLGGDSLLTAVLMTYVEEAFEVEVFAGQFYETPTVEGLATIVEQAQQGTRRSTAPLQLRDDVHLHPDIGALGRSLHWVNEPRHIVLTGATGYLGAFLLHDLLRHTTATIHCLIRCTTPQQGLQKLQAVMQKYQLWEQVLLSRIVVVPGDLAQPRLGLSVQQFDELGAIADVIFHSGARVDFVRPYSVLRAANVLGTQEVLKLACHTTLKPLHYISTLGIFGAIGHFTGATLVLETADIDPSEHFLYLDDGYAQSKWVAEKCMELARAQGLPISIYRPGFIVGHSQTGAHNPGDFISRLVKGCIQLGSFPELEGYKEQMIPVDCVSRAIVHLAQQPAQLGHTFHLTPPPGQDLLIADLFALLQRSGYSLKGVNFREWTQQLMQQVKQSKENALYPLLPLLCEKVDQQRHTLLELYVNTPDYDCQNTLAGLTGTSIAPLPIQNLFQNVYLPYFIQSGFVPAPSAPTRLHEFSMA